MKDYLKYDEWKIWEDGFHANTNEVTESIMSLGNGKFGLRGNFEERYSGTSLQGSYVGGVWFPDKTRVGWWKNGYPDYFAKVINSINWIGIDVEVDGQPIDIAKTTVIQFRRILDLRVGILRREALLDLGDGRKIALKTHRFCSIAQDHLAQVDYEIQAVNFSGHLALTSYLDGNVRNKDSNHDEYFWEEVYKNVEGDSGVLQMRTKPNPFQVPQFDVCVAMHNEVVAASSSTRKPAIKDGFIGITYAVQCREGEALRVRKTLSILSSNDYPTADLHRRAGQALAALEDKSRLQQAHEEAWKQAWENCDIVINGDVSAQIGIRFNIFHLLQTYNGSDPRLNIGPKGFTGEKYGGVTYWDTEAYCIPFYLASADFAVGRNLLMYRYRHLEKAIVNAEKLGFSGGAALYPMVTMNGEECHNEWEITFEEIHRNGAIAYAIYDYIHQTGDRTYLEAYGLEVLIALARFWAQRVNWSQEKDKYVILGVTGPNEYENNVNNNWYTNYIAVWTLRFTLQSLAEVENLESIAKKTRFNRDEETARWQHIIDHMYFPYDPQRQVFLQQDGFLDKALQTVDEISAHRPINQKWSWDRILRSCFIKQADVLQGLYFFEDDFDDATHRRNFDFYEPMTVHESSLSPCVHAILACKLGKADKAYEMYLRTSRLDLDNYNNDTEDGLHITSMAGTWLAVVRGFAGVRFRNTQLQLNPQLPAHWQSLTFRLRTVEGIKEVHIDHSGYSLKTL